MLGCSVTHKHRDGLVCRQFHHRDRSHGDEKDKPCTTDHHAPANGPPNTLGRDHDALDSAGMGVEARADADMRAVERMGVERPADARHDAGNRCTKQRPLEAERRGDQCGRDRGERSSDNLDNRQLDLCVLLFPHSFLSCTQATGRAVPLLRSVSQGTNAPHDCARCMP